MEAKIAKLSSSAPMPLAITIVSLLGCKPSPEVKEEVVCLVGMSTSRRDAYKVAPLRLDGDTWVSVERKDAIFPGPTPAQAQAAMRAWAEDVSAKDPEAVKDKHIQEARTTLKVLAVDHCGIRSKTGQIMCEVILSFPDNRTVDTDMNFALEGGGWKFVSGK